MYSIACLSACVTSTCARNKSRQINNAQQWVWSEVRVVCDGCMDWWKEGFFFHTLAFNFRVCGYIEKSTKSVTAWCHEKPWWQQPIATKGLEIESFYFHINLYALKKTLDIDRSAHRTKVTHRNIKLDFGLRGLSRYSKRHTTLKKILAGGTHTS